MALVWSQRSGAYWFGALCLVLSTLAYAACHVAPFWQLQNNDDPNLDLPLPHVGLWYSCEDEGTCYRHDYSSDEVYLHVTRGLQLGGLLALVVCLMMTCAANCRRQHPGHKADVALGAFILFTALQSVSGTLVYLAFTVNDVHDYEWAFAVSLGSSGLALLSAAIFLSSLCCQRSSCAASPDLDKTETVINWNDEDNYADPAQMFRGEEFGQDGPYTVNNYHEAYFVDDVPRRHDHDNDDDDLDLDLDFDLALSGDPRSLLHLPPPGKSGVPSALSAQNLYTAFPPTTAGRGEVLSKLYDTRENATGIIRHAGHVDHDDDDDRLPNSWSWYEGLEMAPLQSPVWRRRAEERWHYSHTAGGGGSGKKNGIGPPSSSLSLSSAQQSEAVGDVRPAGSPRAAAHGLSPFMFPRVVIRGYYEPGQGYPEYVMRQ